MQLTSISVAMRVRAQVRGGSRTMSPTVKSKTARSTSRSGYRDTNGLVFMPPVGGSRLAFWKTKMEGRGFTFA